MTCKWDGVTISISGIPKVMPRMTATECNYPKGQGVSQPQARAIMSLISARPTGLGPDGRPSRAASVPGSLS
jgi:hypothetical protein